ncbi:MAG: glycosyltransferase family 4 protein [Candidatus Sumerlaeia bacterium]|nr:glycosyltransferase family 4 protein [Candidatus Sumerlaeia bacterium]
MTPRFLFIVSGYPPARCGGMELSCRALATALARWRYAVTVLTLADGPPTDTVENGVRVLRVLEPLAVGPLWGLTYMRQVRRWMRELRDEWDLAVCFHLYLHAAAAVTEARRLGKRCAVRPANFGPGGDRDQLLAHRFGARLLARALEADGFLALSHAGAEELRTAGVPAERLWRLRPFVDMDRFAPAKGDTPPVFVSHGRFVASKNTVALIEAFELLDDASARLRLIGDGPEAGALATRRECSPARDRITIEPWSDAPEVALRGARAFVSASQSEGFSNALLEALACGCPVIASDVSGVRDALDVAGELPDEPIAPGTIGVTAAGYVVAPGDTRMLAAAMSLMIPSSPRVAMARQARSIVEQHFSEDRAREGFLLAARAMIESRPARPWDAQ